MGAGDNLYSIWMAELNLTEFAIFFFFDWQRLQMSVHGSEGSTNAQAENWHFAVPVFNPCHYTIQQGAELPLIIAAYLKVQINIQTWIACLGVCWYFFSSHRALVTI